jgi:hypothetical protein
MARRREQAPVTDLEAARDEYRRLYRLHVSRVLNSGGSTVELAAEVERAHYALRAARTSTKRSRLR